ncbi:class F sortase [Candidatus Blastococcus massiliensis]|uniref:class F sortase n=1 Tax=Candidatus Blastococcus massiliensis TaxID=1470358 RepID=UPI0004B4D5CB|nr:class F sortase [Candidatus Blastococcus massiliensis]
MGVAQAADEPGRLRLAHLSPDTPAVDVALTRAPADGPAVDPGPEVGDALRYGDVGEYAELEPGAYAVSIRPAGTDADTPPALSARIEVPAGGARTLALSGAFAELALTSLTDELAPPGAGTARVRVLGAATGASDLRISVEGGPLLAAGLPFPGTSGYTDVAAGPASVRLASGLGTTTVPLDLRGGTVVSLLVLDDPDGGIVLRPVLDAVSPASVPVGAVEAGGSGALSSAVLAAGPALLPRRVPVAAAVAHAGGSLGPAGASPPGAPVRVRVPGAGVDAVVGVTGLGADGALAVPADPALAGWYAGGPAPGERGPAVLAGHVDWAGRPAVFDGLAGAGPGDEIVVDRADGSSARFAVSRVLQTPKDAFPTDAVYGPVPGAELRLITCGGRFDPVSGSYADNVVVFARLVG